MSTIWYAIGNFFEYIFDFMPAIGNKINYFFVQDKASKELLNLNHINNVSITGDTRIDRVKEISKQEKKFD